MLASNKKLNKEKSEHFQFQVGGSIFAYENWTINIDLLPIIAPLGINNLFHHKTRIL